MEVIDKSKNKLEYESDQPIIYLADIYFKETRVLKGSKKIENHYLNEQVFCQSNCDSTNAFQLSQFRTKIGIKKDSQFEIIKVVLRKKVGYSQIGYKGVSSVIEQEFEVRNRKDWFNKM